MGRFQKRRRNKNTRANKRSSSENDRKTPITSRENGSQYVTTIVERGNFKFEAYYAVQGIHSMRWNENGELVPCQTDEEKRQERLSWRNNIAKVLPASFRIARDVPDILKQSLEKEIQELLEAAVMEEDDGEIIQKIGFLDHAYQLGLDRAKIRKHPALEKLHTWMKHQTSAGFITRQETVSMVPPVVLSVDPTDSVLDMCAAPGSKTSQMLEVLGPTGYIVANDANPQRAHMLWHQLKRVINNPVVLVTACEAQYFPAHVTQFSKILCDVPCSGDGTTRKNIQVWNQWSQMSALSLHALQISIAWKGVSQLLQQGGYLCYSTCSMNPLENEAVVAELLRRAQGSLELVEYQLVGFRTRPGMATWKVFCEEKTRREMKNDRKKHGEKMRKRREMFAQQQSAQEQEAKREDEDVEPDEKNDAVEGCNQKDGELVEGVKEATDGARADKIQSEEADLSTQTDSLAPPGHEVATTAGMQEGNDVATTSGMQEGNDVATTAGMQEEPSSRKPDPANEDDLANADSILSRKFDPQLMDEESLLHLTREAGFQQFLSPADVPTHLARRVRASCFPPTEEESERFRLQRCIRCLAHDNDTGGFFVALLKKVGPISSVERRAEKQRNDVTDTSTPTDVDAEEKDGDEPHKKRARIDNVDEDDIVVDADDEEVANGNTVGVNSKKNVGTGADNNEAEDGDAVSNNDDDENEFEGVEGIDEDNMPVAGRGVGPSKGKGRGKKPDVGKEDFVPIDNALLDPLVEHFGLAPTFRKDLYMTRACGDSKTLFYIARPIKELIDRGVQEQITVINSGLRGFVRNTKDKNVSFRISQESVHFLIPHMTKRKLIVGIDDFNLCLNGGRTINISNFTDEVAAQIRSLSEGSFVLILKGYEEQLDQKMVATMWKCNGDKIDGLISKVEIGSIKTKLKALEDAKRRISSNSSETQL